MNEPHSTNNIYLVLNFQLNFNTYYESDYDDGQNVNKKKSLHEIAREILRILLIALNR